MMSKKSSEPGFMGLNDSPDSNLKKSNKLFNHKNHSSDSEWKEYKLSDLMEIIGGGTPKTSILEYWGGDIPWLSVTDFNNGRKYCFDTEKTITERGLKESSTKILKKGQIIISARGTVGVISMLGRDMAFNQSNYGLVANQLITNNEYLYYLLKHNIPNFVSNAYGAVFDTITKETFNQLIVSIPKLPEQLIIASILSSLDDKIDLLHNQNKTLEQLAETLFRQWFVEEADESWEVGTIEDEFDFIMGQSPLGTSLNENKEGIVFYQGRKDFDFRFPKPRIYTTTITRLAKKFDTLVSVRAPVGNMNMASEDCCLGRGVAAFRYKHNNGFYSYTYYKMRSLISQIKQFEDSGTVFGSIGKDDFKKLENIIPPNKLIEEFQNNVKSLDDKIFSNTIQINTLTQLRDTLLPKLMSGEVRVKMSEL
jgi:type I restriction enzyme, S subunit